MADVQLRGMHVMVGMPLYGAPTTKTVLSLLETQNVCVKSGITFDYTTATGFVTVSRDMILKDFLKSKAEKLFWIDGDMVWTAEAFGRMLALSTLHDIVCAAYPLKEALPYNRYPIMAEAESAENQYGLVEIHATGLGFSVWSREACQALSDSKPVMHDGLIDEMRPAVFCVAPRKGKIRTEDVNAFEDLRALGFKVWLDPTIELGHMGTKEWRGKAIESLEKVEAEKKEA